VRALVLLTPGRSQVQALDQKVRPGLFLAYEERKPTQEQVQDTIALTACLDNFFFGLVSGERACLLHNGDPELPSNPVSADKAAGEMRVLPCVVSIRSRGLSARAVRIWCARIERVRDSDLY